MNNIKPGQEKFWKSLISKYEKRNLELEQKEQQIRQRAEQGTCKKNEEDILKCLCKGLQEQDIRQQIEQNSIKMNEEDIIKCLCEELQEEQETSQHKNNDDIINCLCKDLQEERRDSKNIQPEGDNVSIPSLTSTEFGYLIKVQKLVEREKDLKEKINELEKREQLYLNTLKQADQMWAEKENTFKSCLCKAQNDQTHTELKYAKINEELLCENKRLTDELLDLKLEMKYCIEKVEGPISRQIEKEKCKNAQLEKQLMNTTRNSFQAQQSCLAENNVLKSHFQDACNSLRDVNNLNEKLKAELCELKCLCKELQDEIVQQKINEAETLKKLLQAKQEAPTCPYVCPCVKGKKGPAGDENTLDAIGRKLSAALLDTETCECCKLTIPQDLKDTCQCIKDIVDIVDKKGDDSGGARDDRRESARRESKTPSVRSKESEGKKSKTSPPSVHSKESVAKGSQTSKECECTGSQTSSSSVTSKKCECSSASQISSPSVHSKKSEGKGSQTSPASVHSVHSKEDERKGSKASSPSVHSKKSEGKGSQTSTPSIHSPKASTHSTRASKDSSTKKETRKTSRESQAKSETDQQTDNIAEPADQSTQIVETYEKKTAYEVSATTATESPDEAATQSVQVVGSEDKQTESMIKPASDEKETAVKPETGEAGIFVGIETTIQAPDAIDVKARDTFEMTMGDAKRPSRSSKSSLRKSSADLKAKTQSECSAIRSKASAIPCKAKCSQKGVTLAQQPPEPTPTTPEPDTQALKLVEEEQDEVALGMAVAAMGDADVDVNAQYEIVDGGDEEVRVTTTITDSGTLEVITEGPAGVIETTMVYTDSGHIEVLTEITEYADEDEEESSHTMKAIEGDPSQRKTSSHGEGPTEAAVKTSLSVDKAFFRERASEIEPGGEIIRPPSSTHDGKVTDEEISKPTEDGEHAEVPETEKIKSVDGVASKIKDDLRTDEGDDQVLVEITTTIVGGDKIIVIDESLRTEVPRSELDDTLISHEAKDLEPSAKKEIDADDLVQPITTGSEIPEVTMSKEPDTDHAVKLPEDVPVEHLKVEDIPTEDEKKEPKGDTLESPETPPVKEIEPSTDTKEKTEILREMEKPDVPLQTDFAAEQGITIDHVKSGEDMKDDIGSKDEVSAVDKKPIEEYGRISPEGVDDQKVTDKSVSDGKTALAEKELLAPIEQTEAEKELQHKPASDEKISPIVKEEEKELQPKPVLDDKIASDLRESLEPMEQPGEEKQLQPKSVSGEKIALDVSELPEPMVQPGEEQQLQPKSVSEEKIAQIAKESSEATGQPEEEKEMLPKPEPDEKIEPAAKESPEAREQPEQEKEVPPKPVSDEKTVPVTKESLEPTEQIGKEKELPSEKEISERPKEDQTLVGEEEATKETVPAVTCAELDKTDKPPIPPKPDEVLGDVCAFSKEPRASTKHASPEDETTIEKSSYKPEPLSIQQPEQVEGLTDVYQDIDTDALRKGVTDALSKANKDVIDALEEANRNVANALVKANKNVEDALSNLESVKIQPKSVDQKPVQTLLAVDETHEKTTPSTKVVDVSRTESLVSAIECADHSAHAPSPMDQLKQQYQDILAECQAMKSATEECKSICAARIKEQSTDRKEDKDLQDKVQSDKKEYEAVEVPTERHIDKPLDASESALKHKESQEKGESFYKPTTGDASISEKVSEKPLPMEVESQHLPIEEIFERKMSTVATEKETPENVLIQKEEIPEKEAPEIVLIRKEKTEEIPEKEAPEIVLIRKTEEIPEKQLVVHSEEDLEGTTGIIKEPGIDTVITIDTSIEPDSTVEIDVSVLAPTISTLEKTETEIQIETDIPTSITIEDTYIEKDADVTVDKHDFSEQPIDVSLAAPTVSTLDETDIEIHEKTGSIPIINLVDTIIESQKSEATPTIINIEDTLDLDELDVVLAEENEPTISSVQHVDETEEYIEVIDIEVRLDEETPEIAPTIADQTDIVVEVVTDEEKITGKDKESESSIQLPEDKVVDDERYTEFKDKVDDEIRGTSSKEQVSTVSEVSDTRKVEETSSESIKASTERLSSEISVKERGESIEMENIIEKTEHTSSGSIDKDSPQKPVRRRSSRRSADHSPRKLSIEKPRKASREGSDHARKVVSAEDIAHEDSPSRRPVSAPAESAEVRPCDCVSDDCRCEVCSSDIMQKRGKKKKKPDDCTCTPDCMCKVCSLNAVRPPMRDATNETVTHPPGCYCLSCLCDPCCPAEKPREQKRSVDRSTKTSAIKVSGHPVDCYCLDCLCDNCPDRTSVGTECQNKKEDISTAPPEATAVKPIDIQSSGDQMDAEDCNCVTCVCPGADEIDPKKKHEAICDCQACKCEECPGTNMSLEQKPFECTCVECKCEDCPGLSTRTEKAEGDISESAEKKQMEEGEVESPGDASQHPPTCKCDECICKPCLLENITTEKAEGDTEQKGVKESPEDASKHPPSCECAECICKTCPFLNVTTKDAEKDKSEIPEKKESPGDALLKHPPACDCVICQCPGLSTIPENAECVTTDAGCESENAEQREEINEIKKVIDQIRCACIAAESSASMHGKTFGAGSGRPGQATMSGLQLALSNLQDKCKVKDKMIEALTQELRLRANSKIFNDMLKNLASCTRPAVDYDRTEICATLPRPIDDPAYGKPSHRVQKCHHPEFPNCPCVKNAEMQKPQLPEKAACGHPDYPNCPCVNKRRPSANVAPQPQPQQPGKPPCDHPDFPNCPCVTNKHRPSANVAPQSQPQQPEKPPCGHPDFPNCPCVNKHGPSANLAPQKNTSGAPVKCDHPNFPNCPCTSTKKESVQDPKNDDPCGCPSPGNKNISHEKPKRQEKAPCDHPDFPNCPCVKSPPPASVTPQNNITREPVMAHHADLQNCGCPNTNAQNFAPRRTIPPAGDTVANTYAASPCLCPQGGVNVNPAPLDITCVRKVAPDSLLIKWKLPMSHLVTGYEIEVDGTLKSRVHNAERNSAVIHTLLLTSTANINLFAVTRQGRCLPPATATFQP